MRSLPDCSLRIGHAGEARDLHRVSESGILAVVDLALNEPPATPAREVVYLRFPIGDGAGNPPWLLRAAVEAVAGLIRAEIPTLIACGFGMSRAPCIAAAALARARGYTPEEALTIVVATGPADVAPDLWAEVRATVQGLS